jgi:hypothetical protein
VTRRRLVPVALLALLLFVPSAADGASHRPHQVRGGSAYQPDGWIKLCGLSLGCTIDPLPHPWRGKDVYNTSGGRQTVVVDINEGEGVRFWITLQNDGAQTETFGVRGCRGNQTYEVNAVLIGKHKRQDAGAKNVTNAYKRGTLTFDLDAGNKVVFTLNIITHFNKNVTYLCRTEFTSASDPSSEDVVVAKMTTY